MKLYSSEPLRAVSFLNHVHSENKIQQDTAVILLFLVNTGKMQADVQLPVH